VSIVTGNDAGSAKRQTENSDDRCVGPAEQARPGRVERGLAVSDPGRQELDSIGLAPTGLHERNDWNPNPSGHAKDGPDGSQREPYETVVHLRTVEDREARAQRQPDIFAEAVAKAMQEQLEPEFVEAPSVLKNRHQVGAAGKSAAAAGVAALIALAFVVVSQESAEEGALSALPTWQSLKSSLFPAPQGKPAPMLAVRDGSGPVNEPLSLGVRINPPGRGATITIGKMPDGARLTVGRRVNDSEWRVPAQEISNAAMVPPADFAGVMNLTAELRDSGGTSLVSSLFRLSWTAPGSGSTAGMSASAPAVSPGPATPQQQQLVVPPAPAAAASAEPPARDIDPNEVAGFIRRAQDLLTTGDLQAARLLLLRAAEAHDSRAALILAKTFDPMMSKQFGGADPEPDLAQARRWYQKADEWGAPEAQRQLDALASYSR
jgi:hypothetical protein